MTGARGFETRCERYDNAALVVARGELDLASSEELARALDQADAGTGTVILDLRGVTFIDSSGLSAIVGEHRRSQAAGFRFVVAVGGARLVERLFRLTGLYGTLEIVEAPDSLLVS